MEGVVDREYHSWFSPHLEREMELLIFGKTGPKVLVFPTRCSRFHEYEDLRLVERLSPKLEGGQLQLFCVDSIDQESFYCNWAEPAGRLLRHQQYEAYLLHEVMPLIRKKNPNPCLISHGCSFGAYHAVNFACRHPWLFQKVIALSGRYDLTTPVEWFGDLLEGYYNEEVYYQMPNHYLPNLTDPAYLEPLRQLKFVLVIGEEDPFLESNRQLSAALSSQHIPHTLHIWPERAHRGYYWRRMVPLYL